MDKKEKAIHENIEETAKTLLPKALQWKQVLNNLFTNLFEQSYLLSILILESQHFFPF